MVNVSVRRAAVSDTDALLCYDFHIGRETLMKQIEDGFVFAVLSCERTVGILRYGLLWQAHPFLELLFLDAACRGHGFGKACMRFWENLMREAGYRYVLTKPQNFSMKSWDMSSAAPFFRRSRKRRSLSTVKSFDAFFRESTI